MPPSMANRFALFAESGENKPPVAQQTPSKDNPFVNQVSDDSVPWQQVKRGNARRQSQSSGSKPPALVIRDSTKTFFVGTRGKQREVSSSIQESSPVTDDPHENWCGVCSHKFGTKAALLSHIKTAPAGHSNYCNLCKRVFKDRNGLKNHVDNSMGHEVHCNLCLSAFKDDWALKCHFENNLSVGHQWVCLTCLVGFRTKMELKQHYRTGRKHVVCNTCHRIFRDQDERDAHWRNTSKHHHCLQPGCEFDTRTAELLEKHLSEDHFRCEGCKAVLPSQTKLGQHYDTCTASVECPDCGLPCAGQRDLLHHSESCVGTQEDENVEIDKHDTEFGEVGSQQSAPTNTPHVPTSRGCFYCSALLPSHTALIAHLERGACPSLPDSTMLTLCLGKWWYSPLYMDLDLHAQIRRDAIDLQETTAWMNQGFLRPFMCRNDACGDASFARFSELVAHVESGNCVWNMERLRLNKLGRELNALLRRRESEASG